MADRAAGKGHGQRQQDQEPSRHSFPSCGSIMGSSITLNRLGYSEGHSEFGGFHLVHALRSSSQIQPPSKTSLQHLQNHPDATEPIPYW
jgi:hypothetical protein